MLLIEINIYLNIFKHYNSRVKVKELLFMILMMYHDVCY